MRTNPARLPRLIHTMLITCALMAMTGCVSSYERVAWEGTRALPEGGTTFEFTAPSGGTLRYETKGSGKFHMEVRSDPDVPNPGFSQSAGGGGNQSLPVTDRGLLIITPERPGEVSVTIVISRVSLSHSEGVLSLRRLEQ